MSKFTLEQLRDWNLTGYGYVPWHSDADTTDSNGEKIVYPGAIPLADITRRLFNFQPRKLPVYAFAPATFEDCDAIRDGSPVRFVEVPETCAVARDDTWQILGGRDGIHSADYNADSFGYWLIDQIMPLVSPDTGIGSALVLDDGAIGVVSFRLPTATDTDAGLSGIPYLSCATSFTGKIPNTYKGSITLPVCDNTTDAMLAESNAAYKVKRTKFATDRFSIESAADVLSYLELASEQFVSAVANLAAFTVDTREWDMLLDAIIPVPEKSGRGATLAEKKRDEIHSLWVSDSRVSPWTGTALGALQAFNTWNEHFRGVRTGSEEDAVQSTAKALRNARETLTGTIGKHDANILAALAKVTGRQLVGAAS